MVSAAMADPAQQRTGLLVIRVWIEGDPGTGLRCRITRSLDLSSPEQVVTATTSIDEVLATARAWLEAFIGAHSSK
jgi:hypothetical protein